MIRDDYRVELASWSDDLAELRQVRERVFIVEQQVPSEAEWDDIDAQSTHVLVRDAAGQPIGTGRLSPENRIGRVAVLAAWRSRGIGEAIMRVLLDAARSRGATRVELHSQMHALPFYQRLGFTAVGEEYHECDIPHRTMVIDLPAFERPMAPLPPEVDTASILRVRNRDELIQAHLRLLAEARYEVAILSHDLDPGVLDNADVVAELRRIALSGRRARIRILVRLPSSRSAALIALAQRLPSTIAIRCPVEDEDRLSELGLVLNDQAGYLQRNDATRADGHGSMDAASRQRPLLRRFDEMWERAEPSIEQRVLSI